VADSPHLFVVVAFRWTSRSSTLTSLLTVFEAPLSVVNVRSTWKPSSVLVRDPLPWTLPERLSPDHVLPDRLTLPRDDVPREDADTDPRDLEDSVLRERWAHNTSVWAQKTATATINAVMLRVIVPSCRRPPRR
jgi:hypothetical protein